MIFLKGGNMNGFFGHGYLKKMNNRGMAMITVLVVLAFFVIVTGTTLSVVVSNYNRKVADEEATENTYVAETALDEIKSGIQSKLAQVISSTYTTILTDSTITDKSSAFSDQVLSQMEAFIQGESSEGQYDLNGLKTLSQTYGGDSALVLASADAEPSYTLSASDAVLTIKNLVLSYTNADDFYSAIKTDIVLEIPKDIGFPTVTISEEGTGAALTKSSTIYASYLWLQGTGSITLKGDAFFSYKNMGANTNSSETVALKLTERSTLIQNTGTMQVDGDFEIEDKNDEEYWGWGYVANTGTNVVVAGNIKLTARNTSRTCNPVLKFNGNTMVVYGNLVAQSPEQMIQIGAGSKLIVYGNIMTTSGTTYSEAQITALEAATGGTIDVKGMDLETIYEMSAYKDIKSVAEDSMYFNKNLYTALNKLNGFSNAFKGNTYVSSLQKYISSIWSVAAGEMWHLNGINNENAFYGIYLLMRQEINTSSWNGTEIHGLVFSTARLINYDKDFTIVGGDADILVEALNTWTAYTSLSDSLYYIPYAVPPYAFSNLSGKTVVILTNNLNLTLDDLETAGYIPSSSAVTYQIKYYDYSTYDRNKYTEALEEAYETEDAVAIFNYFNNNGSFVNVGTADYTDYDTGKSYTSANGNPVGTIPLVAMKLSALLNYDGSVVSGSSSGSSTSSGTSASSILDLSGFSGESLDLNTLVYYENYTMQ